MKATFALLTDDAVLNVVSKTAWQLHLAHRTGISCRRLPPHVSLRQPFEVADLDALDAYMEQLAQSIAPFSIVLGDYILWEYPPDNPTSGVLSIQVLENDILRSLHQRLNEELSERFGDTRADFDGDVYSFHITVAAGGGSLAEYREAFAEVAGVSAARQFEARELALFVYDRDDYHEDWQYLMYRVLPLG